MDKGLSVFQFSQRVKKTQIAYTLSLPFVVLVGATRFYVAYTCSNKSYKTYSDLNEAIKKESITFDETTQA